jgi:hypothetical protein
MTLEVPSWAGETARMLPYPLLFATASGAHLYGSRLQWCPDRSAEPVGIPMTATVTKYGSTGSEFAHEPCEEP